MVLGIRLQILASRFGGGGSVSGLVGASSLELCTSQHEPRQKKKQRPYFASNTGCFIEIDL